MGRRAMGTAFHAPPTTSRCVVVGASARAFAESATRAGWVVHAADLFGDRDLIDIVAEAVRLAPADYPDGLPRTITGFPAGPWAYTGALENHPDVIAAIGRVRPLAGCDAAAVRTVRDPSALAVVVRDAGLRFPETHDSSVAVPADGTFLAKPLASAGGRAIRPWRGGTPRAARGRTCWQRFVPGGGWSAAYVADARHTTLVGASRPVGCRRACGARRFAYCGSRDVPLPGVPDALRDGFETVGRRIAAAFGLRGCFGLDAIVDDAGRVHVLEVNPRPTASLELVERASGWSVAAAHFAACGWGRDPGPPRPQGVVWAKAIVRTPRHVRQPLAEAILEAAEPWARADGRPAVADIPAADVPLPAGGPLVTVFACGSGPREAESLLRGRVQRLRRLVQGGVSPPGGGRPRRRASRARTASGTRPRSSPGRSP